MHQTIQQAESAQEDYGIPCCGRRLGQVTGQENNAGEQEEEMTPQKI